jgi:hypothetical protein
MAEGSWRGALRETLREGAESVALRTLEPLLRRWLVGGFSKEQLRFDGSTAHLFDLSLDPQELHTARAWLQRSRWCLWC